MVGFYLVQFTLLFISRPLSAQLMIFSRFPYQRRKSPPLLYGTHFDVDHSRFIRLVLARATSYHSRRNTSFSPVSMPFRGSETYSSNSPLAYKSLSRWLIQYANIVAGIF